MKITELIEKNRRWSEAIHEQSPDFFRGLCEQQSPEYLWIGCSDSRVPATQLVGLQPGELFVHRNVANVVVHSDLNCLSVLQYAVEVLRVKHILVIGHYGCGGVYAALHLQKMGLIDNWLRHVRDVYEKHAAVIETLLDDEARHRRLCELNVIEQAYNVCQTTIVQSAWEGGQELAVHGMIYGLEDGLLRDLQIHVSHQEAIVGMYQAAVASVS